MTTRIHVVAAVFRDRDRVLACRRAPAKSQGGKWEFPGGKVEPGESPQAALVREIREELGVDVVVGGLIDRTATQVGTAVIDLACYDVERAGEPPTASTDHDQLRWVAPTEISGLDWAAPDLPAVRAILQRTP